LVTSVVNPPGTVCTIPCNKSCDKDCRAKGFKRGGCVSTYVKKGICCCSDS